MVLLVCPRAFDASWVAQLDSGFRDVFARRTPFALVTDTTAVASMPGPLERKALTDWASRPDQLALQKELNVGSSTVVKSALMRGGLQALYWFWTPASPQHAARDFDEAWAWCLAKLDERRVALPHPPRELRRLADRDRALADDQAMPAPRGR